MTAQTATADNVNTSVQKIKTLVQTATTAIGQAHGSGSGNPLTLVGTTINVCICFEDTSLVTDRLIKQSVMTAVNKAHSVSTEQTDVLVVIKVLEYVISLFSYSVH